jgi:hypothetical protein
MNVYENISYRVQMYIATLRQVLTDCIRSHDTDICRIHNYSFILVVESSTTNGIYIVFAEERNPLSQKFTKCSWLYLARRVHYTAVLNTWRS